MQLAVIKDSFKTYFEENEKLLPMEEIFEILAQNGLNNALGWRSPWKIYETMEENGFH